MGKCQLWMNCVDSYHVVTWDTVCTPDGTEDNDIRTYCVDQPFLHTLLNWKVLLTSLVRSSVLYLYGLAICKSKASLNKTKLDFGRYFNMFYRIYTQMESPFAIEPIV